VVSVGGVLAEEVGNRKGHRRVEFTRAA
jgi:hypothetical protein